MDGTTHVWMVHVWRVHVEGTCGGYTCVESTYMCGGRVPYSLESTPTSERMPTPLFSPKFHLKAFLLRLYAHFLLSMRNHFMHV